MPLINSGSNKARSSNIAIEMNAGRPRAQAVAIGYAQQRRAKRPKQVTVAEAKRMRRRGQ